MNPDGDRPLSDSRASSAFDPAFHVDCDCGTRTPVTEGQAGLRLTCSCGRTLLVPSLHELRIQAGLPPFPVSTATQVEELVKAGRLPASKACARCSEPTVAILHAVAACEFLWITTEGWSVYGVVVSEREVSQHGKQVVVPVPLRLCSDCQQAIFPHPLTGWFRPLAVALAILGVALLLILHNTLVGMAGVVPLAVAALLYLAPVWVMRKQQRALKRLLRQTPLYDQLLSEYPDAIIHI
jgi:hypothetical protein